MKPSVPYVVFLIGILSLAGGPLHAQQLSDDDIEAMLRTRQFEVGGSRTTKPEIDEEGHPAEDGRDEAEDTPASNDAGTEASGAVRESLDAGGITGLAKSLMDAAMGRAGGLPLSQLGTLGQGPLGSVFDAASAIGAIDGNASRLPGADAEGLLQQIGSLLETPVGTTGTPAPVPAASSLDNARALLDAYNAATSASSAAEGEAGNEALAPVPSDTRANVRVQPSRRIALERREEEEREQLPWETSSREASRGDAAGRESSSPARASATGTVPAGAARAAPTTGSEHPATGASGATPRQLRPAGRPDAESTAARVSDEAASESGPERYRDLLDAVPSYEDAVAEREGDWFVVLGSYNVRAGATPIPSGVDGSVAPSASASIVGAQQRLWQAGYAPYVVRSDALPEFQKGLAVIVLGPLPRNAAIAELPALRKIVSDAYIKAGW